MSLNRFSTALLLYYACNGADVFHVRRDFIDLGTNGIELGAIGKVDIRLQQLSQWVASTLPAPVAGIAPASSDASFRRYFRVHAGDTTYIAMDAPPPKEDCRPFVRIARAFKSVGVNVPEILFQDLENGFLLLSDFGTTLYLSALNAGTADRLYGNAMASLLTLQRGTDAALLELPPYDRDLLWREMELFREWFLGKHLGISLGSSLDKMITETFAQLANIALSQPVSWVHRDYHSRNLMVVPGDKPGVLDFQDAVVGPVTYDLVSLLKDCYISWPRQQLEGWVRHFYDEWHKGASKVSFEEFLYWFDMMGVQRQLKAIGIFARLNLRDGKPGYLGDIPRTLGYVLDTLPRYKMLPEFSSFLQLEIEPRLAL